MKLIIARFFDTRLKFELGEAVVEDGLELLSWETGIGRFCRRDLGTGVEVFLTTDDTDVMKIELDYKCASVCSVVLGGRFFTQWWAATKND